MILVTLTFDFADLPTVSACVSPPCKSVEAEVIIVVLMYASAVLMYVSATFWLPVDSLHHY